jgi:hypothetical protein
MRAEFTSHEKMSSHNKLELYCPPSHQMFMLRENTDLYRRIFKDIYTVTIEISEYFGSLKSSIQNIVSKGKKTMCFATGYLPVLSLGFSAICAACRGVAYIIW